MLGDDTIRRTQRDIFILHRAVGLVTAFSNQVLSSTSVGPSATDLLVLIFCQSLFSHPIRDIMTGCFGSHPDNITPEAHRDHSIDILAPSSLFPSLNNAVQTASMPLTFQPFKLLRTFCTSRRAWSISSSKPCSAYWSLTS